jgi:hypothetical protein
MAETASARAVPNARHTHPIDAASITTTNFATTVYGLTTTSIDPDDATAAGTATTVSRSDHQHQFTCAAPVAIGTANAEGVATTAARSDHVHDLAAGVIDSATFFTDGVITAAKVNHEAWTTATPTFTNVTLGTGGTSSMAYIQIGRTVHFRAGFTLGTGGAATGEISLTLPVNSSAGRRFVGVAGATGPLGATYAGVATIGASSVIFYSVSSWAATSPFTWASGHELTVSGTYEAAS